METYFIALKSSLLLLAWWFFLTYFWRDYRIDAFRDHVFGIRHRLFMFAANGSVSFSHPAYTMLRYRMNVVLRYAHLFTLFRLSAALLVFRRPKKSQEMAAWEKYVDALPHEAAMQLREFDIILAIAILQLMVFRSFLLYVIFRPFMRFIPTRLVIRKTPTVKMQVEQLESEALEEDNQRRADRDLVTVS